jgi:hypothetical protein
MAASKRKGPLRLCSCDRAADKGKPRTSCREAYRRFVPVWWREVDSNPRCRLFALFSRIERHFRFPRENSARQPA